MDFYLRSTVFWFIRHIGLGILSIELSTGTDAKTLRPTVFLTKSLKPTYSLRYGCTRVFAQRKLPLAPKWTQTELARLEADENQHKHFCFTKGNLFYAAQTQAMTPQSTRELPAKLRHQQSMQFRTRSVSGMGSAA